jgi:spermidine/putrescine-binding protein
MNRVPRRGGPRILALAAAFAASLALAACGGDDDKTGTADSGSGESSAPTELNMISWEGYNEAAWVEPFEKDNNVKINVTYIASDDELFAKIRAGGGKAFDLATLREAGLIVPLDESKLPAFENVVAPIKPRTTVDGELLAVPYVWGSIPLLYSKTEFPTPPDSWDVVFGDKACGKVLMSEDAGTTIATAALYLGFPNPYKLDDSQFEEVKKLLEKTKTCTKAFYSGFGDAANYFASGDVVAGISLGSLITKLAEEKGAEVGETVPKEGAIGWVDTWMVTKAGAEKADVVYKWLNYVESPEVQLGVSKKTNFAPVVEGVAEDLDPDIRTTLHLDDPTYLQKLIPQESPQAPDTWEKRLALWNTIRGQ